jgi:hypothetical protein
MGFVPDLCAPLAAASPWGEQPRAGRASGRGGEGQGILQVYLRLRVNLTQQGRRRVLLWLYIYAMFSDPASKLMCCSSSDSFSAY